MLEDILAVEEEHADDLLNLLKELGQPVWIPGHTRRAHLSVAPPL